MNAIVPSSPDLATIRAATEISLASVLARLSVEIPAAVIALPPPADPAPEVESPETIDLAARHIEAGDAPEIAQEEDAPEVAEPEPVRYGQVTVDRAALAGALAMVESVIERRNYVPILSNALMVAGNGALAIEGTDLDMTVRVTIPCDGADEFAMTAPAHMMKDIAGRRKEGEMTIAFEEIGLSFKSGRSAFTLQTLPATDYPDLVNDGFPVAFTMPAEQLCETLKGVAFAISTEETRYYLNGILFHPKRVHRGAPVTLRMVATDGHRLAVMDTDSKVGGKAWGKLRNGKSAQAQGVIVPRKAVAMLLSLLAKSPKVKKGETLPDRMVSVEVSDTKVRFTCGNIVVTSKLIDGTFPDYCRVIPEGNDKILRVDIDELAEAIDTVSVISSERGRAVRLGLSVDTLALSVNNPDSGSARETVTVDYTGDDMDIGFNARYLLDALKHLTPPAKRKANETREVTIRLADPGSPTIFESGYGPKVVLMPMRI